MSHNYVASYLADDIQKKQETKLLPRGPRTWRHTMEIAYILDQALELYHFLCKRQRTQADTHVVRSRLMTTTQPRNYVPTVRNQGVIIEDATSLGTSSTFPGPSRDLAKIW